MKILDQLHIINYPDWRDLLASVASSVSALPPKLNSGDGEVSALSFANVIIINGAQVKEEDSFKQALYQLELTHGQRLQHVNIYLLHLTATERLTSISSRLYVEYVDCFNDFEWVLSSVLKRIQSIRCKNAHLKFELISHSEIKIDSEPFVCPSVVTAGSRTQMISYGLCDESQVLNLSGAFTCSPARFQSDMRKPFVEVTFAYFFSNKQICEERTALCLREDIRNEIHIERIKRNMELSLREDNALLLEQRRLLMSEKTSFQLALGDRYVAEAENTFKKTNIMKEELWAKRTWILERGLRLFEESELEQLEREANDIGTKFRRRLDNLVAQYSITFREGSRGHADNGAHRVRGVYRSSTIKDKETTSDTDESLESIKLRHQKLLFKTDLWTTQLVDLEAKMFDMHGSVRAAQSKGFVIMNDSRRSWYAKYNDLMDAKRQSLLTMRTKAQLEQKMVILELQQQRAHETKDRISAMNRMLARYEKEHIKRKKRIFLSMKELIAYTQSEFEASAMIEKTKRNIRQCKLMDCPSLPQDVYPSCVRVFFPVDISSQESNCPRSIGLNNTMQCLLFGLRHYCRTDSQTPYCKRLSQNGGFLWTHLEQRSLEARSDEYEANKKKLEQDCWATVIVTYNSLFASLTAAQELRELQFGLKSKKCVIHIEMEEPFHNLDEFRYDWMQRQSLSRTSGSYSSQNNVEKEYFRWKQNLSSFEAVMRSTDTQTLRLHENLTCQKCQDRRLENVSHLLPCLDCCRPYVSRSSHQTPLEYRATMSMGILDIIHAIGKWLDDIASSSIKSTARNHLLDPKDISPFSSLCHQQWNTQLVEQRGKWEEKISLRKREMDKQIQKIFKVYEEEATEIMNLNFAFESFKRDTRAFAEDKLKMYRYEQDLVRNAMMSTDTEALDKRAHHHEELTRMLREEMHHALIDPEIIVLELEAVEENEEQKGQDILIAEVVYHQALKRSNRFIANYGAHFIDYKLQEADDLYKVQGLQDQSNHIDSLYRFEEVRKPCYNAFLLSGD